MRAVPRPRAQTLRRLLIGVPLLLVLLWGVWAGWRAYQVQGELRAAEQAARQAMAAASAGDQTALDTSVGELRTRAARAAELTSGPTWSLLGKVPFVGDDARGVRALSHSLDVIGQDATDPLMRTLATVRQAQSGGGINLASIEAIERPVTAGHAAVTAAATELHEQDSAGFLSPLRTRYDEFVAMVDDLDDAMSAAVDATRVLPTALGGAGERNYLMVFLNNAEIRTSGGMPGAYAHVRAVNGKISLVSQGNPGDLGAPPAQPVLPLSTAEQSFFGEQLGIYFQDANFIQDMPRTADLMAARWKLVTGQDLDGVLTLDTVGMSYLLDGAGPVTTPDGLRLTSANAVQELLNGTYLTIPDPAVQDARFAAVASSTFTAVTSNVADQFALVKGMGRAADEGRLLVHLFDADAQQVLAGSRMAGELTNAPQGSPEVDLGFDDVTASKMSYYLRYHPEVQATSCADGVQQMTGRVSVSSELSAELAASLPVSVVNDGSFGTAPGSQMTLVRIYGPSAGSIAEVRVDGTKVDVDRVRLNGRPAVALALLLEPSQTSVVEWTMTSGAGQTGPVDLSVTPSIVPGTLDATLPSACS